MRIDAATAADAKTYDAVANANAAAAGAVQTTNRAWQHARAESAAYQRQ